MAQPRASLTTTLRRHDVRMLRLIVSLLIAVSQLGAVSHAQTTRESISRLPALASSQVCWLPVVVAAAAPGSQLQTERHVSVCQASMQSQTCSSSAALSLHGQCSRDTTRRNTHLFTFE